MTGTSMLHPTTTSVSTFGVQVAYELPCAPRPTDILETGFIEYGLRAPPRKHAVERREPPTTRPVSRGVYFGKVSQSPAIECYYFRGHHTGVAPDDPTETHTRGINSSLRDVSTMLFVAAVNARSAGEDTRPLIRPERKATGGEGRFIRTWIAQEATDISEMIRTSRGRHRHSILTDLIERASELARLKAGWNSYSAPAPTPVAIGNAKTLLTLASSAGIIPERIEPSAMGGVGVTFTAGSREAAVEFYNAGNAHALFSDKETESLETASVAQGVVGYLGLLEKVRRYLYGHTAAAQTPRPKLPRR